ncbi:hypothetical protein HETIRDRAFT_430835 [Heterobasidion irregulare TC 32-1]|uniref:Uncharacterized protein n=1 Tax=Heterobasidion irregulare (strain TC 32-1) TaxID=747525 RepID=W4JPJ6_HETIT|nr:uncharacterized protein HETIRDRAFT_430835 [Heterobasidion irregulare TC 32-1]ETW75497.1 hypothetical protein HETIRDRAFT_430835 [Heterobasidion irregulare TC 32-1]
MLEAGSASLLPLFLPSSSPTPAPAASSSLLLLPAGAGLASATKALDRMSMDSTFLLLRPIRRESSAPAPLSLSSLGSEHQPKRNGARKLLQDPPGLLPGDVLAKYACHWCTTEFATVAPQCYTRPGQAKAKLGAKSVENERPIKKHKVEVLVPERPAGESITQSKAIQSRKPVKCLPTTTQHLSVPSHSSRSTRLTSTAAPSPKLSCLSPSVARGVTSKIRYHIAVAEGLRAFLAQSITMWRAKLEALEAWLGPSAPLDIVLVEDSSEADDSGRLASGDFVPND